MLNSIRDLILSPAFGNYHSLAYSLLLIGCSLGFPFSSDLTLLTAGILAGTGYFDLKMAITLGFFSILFGDTLAFFIGRKWGSRILRHRYFYKICPPGRLETISQFLRENDARFIFMVRFTPGLRSIIFLSSGAMGIKPSTFFKMDALSTAIYVPSLITLSYLAANKAEVILQNFQNFHRIMLIVFGIGIIVFLCVHFLRRSRTKAVQEK